uniref:Uncharacterized protein n=1 Tax=Varanus komodoensis TaxID=61221 RepID=A0A8D2IXD1_VARKO
LEPWTKTLIQFRINSLKGAELAIQLKGSFTSWMLCSDLVGRLTLIKYFSGARAGQGMRPCRTVNHLWARSGP